MIDINELRQSLGAVSPEEVAELLDRLEAAETTWKVSEKSCYDLTEKVIPNLRDQLEAAEKERDALRAKIEALEQQKPYAFAVAFPETSRVELVHDLDDLFEDLTYEAHDVRKLYLTPGAKGEGK